MEILHIENLSFKYPKTENNAVDSVSLNVGSGDFIVICGESGCGKTTLLKLLKKSSPLLEKRADTFSTKESNRKSLMIKQALPK